jgi:tRNA G10  N-methylase Trm11
MKRRRSLTHVGGAVETAGDRDVAARLAAALDVAPAPEPKGTVSESDDPDRSHVHGFHTYPARMHPVTAAHLVRVVSGDSATLLDPFCGSGTVLVEAMIAGRRAVGTDLNPLAVRLARLKTSMLDDAACAATLAAAREIAKLADERRTRRAGATRRYPPEDVALFEPHVLLELDSIRAGITGRQEAGVGEALGLVLSAIFVKVSRRASDTSGAAASRRIAAGYPARLFVRKAEELVRRIAVLRGLLPPGAMAACVELDDATRLRTLKASTVDAIVTSPPYPGTYDYVAQHALRLRWLGIDSAAFAAGEIGSRRRYATLDARGARDAWSREFGASLRAMARVCRKGARAALIMADSGTRGEALRADAILAQEARAAGFELIARASQTRPHFHGETARAFQSVPRAEHALVIEKR